MRPQDVDSRTREKVKSAFSDVYLSRNVWFYDSCPCKLPAAQKSSRKRIDIAFILEQRGFCFPIL